MVAATALTGTAASLGGLAAAWHLDTPAGPTIICAAAVIFVNGSMVTVTVFAVASALARYPQIVESMQEAGWEIATHGLKWIDYRDAPAEVDAAHAGLGGEVHEDPLLGGGRLGAELARGGDRPGRRLAPDHRDRRLAGDRRQRVGVLLSRAGHAHDVAAGRRELGDLLQRRVDVVRLGVGHGLDRHRVITAHADRADVQLPGSAPRRQHRRRCVGHTQSDRDRG